jgi:hypothetical protein
MQNELLEALWQLLAEMGRARSRSDILLERRLERIARRLIDILAAWPLPDSRGAKKLPAPRVMPQSPTPRVHGCNPPSKELPPHDDPGRVVNAAVLAASPDRAPA